MVQVVTLMAFLLFSQVLIKQLVLTLILLFYCCNKHQSSNITCFLHNLQSQITSAECQVGSYTTVGGGLNSLTAKAKHSCGLSKIPKTVINTTKVLRIYTPHTTIKQAGKRIK